MQLTIMESKKELIIKSDPRNLAQAREFVQTFAKYWGFGEEQIFDIKVATGEAVSNAIEHGSPKGKLNDIVLQLRFNDQELILKVIDEGSFKPVIKVDDPDPHHRGRGIPFMLALMDKVTINETKSGTVVQLVKKLKRVE